MKLKQLLVLLAAPVAVSTNAFDDTNLAWQYDDDYDDDNGYDDDGHEDLSSGPPLGFLQEALSQDRSEGYVSSTFNGTTTALESYGGEEHSRRLAGGFCIGGIIIAFVAVTQAFNSNHVAHMPIKSHSDTSLKMAIDQFNPPVKQKFLLKVENKNGVLLDPKEYLEIDTVSGSGSCAEDIQSEGTAWVRVMCADASSGKLEFTVKAIKKIGRKWKVTIMPMYGTRRDLSQKNAKNGDIFNPSDYYGTYWEKKAGAKKKKGEDACTIIANKLPDEYNKDQFKIESAAIIKQVFETYVKAKIPAIGLMLQNADWDSLSNFLKEIAILRRTWIWHHKYPHRCW